MKNILPVIVLFIPLSSIGQKEEKKPWFSGMIEYEDDIHIYATEVSYADWFAFIYDNYSDDEIVAFEHLIPAVKKSESLALWNYFKRNWDEGNYSKLKISYTMITYQVWLTKEEKSNSANIKRHLQLPITGLTRSQIGEYLEWMKEMQTEIYLAGYDNYKIEIDLPSEVLYARLFKGTKREGAVGDSVNVKGCPLFNFYMINECPSTEERMKIYGNQNGIVAVEDYFPDINGYYNIVGNVAEMTSTSGVAFGGNYTQFAKDILSNPKTNYSEGDTLIGFRYVIKLSQK